mgnify:FL=1
MIVACAVKKNNWTEARAPAVLSGRNPIKNSIPGGKVPSAGDVRPIAAANAIGSFDGGGFSRRTPPGRIRVYTAPSSESGSESVKTVPSPAALCTPTAPPCLSAMSRTSVRPRPEPPIARERDRSAR